MAAVIALVEERRTQASTSQEDVSSPVYLKETFRLTPVSEYDATRLSPAEVESALAAAGIPIAPELA